MNDEKILELENHLKNLITSSSESNKIYLAQTRQKFDESLRDIINIYSNEIRNLAIISGVIAPFSLNLLEIEKLNTNKFLLLLGFCLSLINIPIAQYFLSKQSNKYNKKINEAFIALVFADINKEKLEDNLIQNTDKALVLNELFNNIEEANKKLGGASLDLYLLDKKNYLKKSNDLVIMILTLAVLCIIFSVIRTPLFDILEHFFTLLLTSWV